MVQIYAATNGYLDRINVERVPEFLEQLTQRFHAEQQELGKKIAGGDWRRRDRGELDKFVKEFADDFGYDLDEEGQPLDDGRRPDRASARARQRRRRGGGGRPPRRRAEEPEQEPAAV